MRAPEVGKRYRVEATVDVVDVETDGLIGLRIGRRPTTFIAGGVWEVFTWIEIEPEYEFGQYWISEVNGLVWYRAAGNGWILGGPGGAREDHDQPKRPLTRLYREDER